jgi:hypothetical protein
MSAPRRRGLRLRHYDDARAGCYFVTVCTAGRVSLFGEIVGGAMQLNPLWVPSVSRRYR